MTALSWAVITLLWLPASVCATPPLDDQGKAVRALLRLQDVPLTVHPTCSGVGSDPADGTVGDYVGGFLAHMTGGSNRVEGRCLPNDSKGIARRCTVWLKHADDEDEWAWGLQFDLDPRGRPVRRSVRCLGGG